MAQSHSDAELERVIRHGIRQSGISTQGMPSPMFYHLSDADLAAILVFIRSEPVGDGPATDVHLGPLGRWQLLFGDWLPYAEEIDHQAVRLDPGGPAQPLVWGRYLAETVCTECHGADLAGGGDTPNLVVAAAYSLADFRRLLRTGVPVGERQLGLMAKVAVKRFAHFTDPEIAALHGFLRQRAGLPAAP